MSLKVAVVMGLCIALVPSGCRQSDPAPAPAAAADAAQAPATSAPPDEPADRPSSRTKSLVTLAFAGDSHFQLNLSRLPERPRGGLGPVDTLLGDADLTMLNLETAITDGGSLDPKEREAPGDRFWYRAPPSSLDVLARAGVDVVSMANNHAADYGSKGFADTLRAIGESRVAVVGVGRNRASAFAAHRVTVNGTRIAVVAADTSVRESSSPLWAAGPHSPGVAAARPGHTADLLRAVRRERGRTVVVVYLHWGIDDRSCPSDVQQRLARELADAGADVVVGSSAHVQQGSGWLGDTYVSSGSATSSGTTTTTPTLACSGCGSWTAGWSPTAGRPRASRSSGLPSRSGGRSESRPSIGGGRCASAPSSPPRRPHDRVPRSRPRSTGSGQEDSNACAPPTVPGARSRGPD